MSHSNIIYSPVGTPLLDRTVGEIVAERPAQSRIFQSFGIDFCCQGGRTVREACMRKGISAEAVVEQLEAELRDKPAPEVNPAELPLEELVGYIVTTHHQYLREELPRLLAMAARVAEVHGGHTPSLVEVDAVLRELAAELMNQLSKEESVLFPAILALTRREKMDLSLDLALATMLQEHDDAGTALVRLRDRSNGFLPPPEACNTYRALFAGLADLEQDLHRHIHLENAVMSPQVRQMALA
jgi:regulator of cell morphogenesis and NO signaling